MSEPANRRVFNQFTELLAEGVYFYEQSVASGTPAQQLTNSKLSILLSLFALEAAANAFLFSLDLPNILAKNVERIALLDKFQLFLEVRKMHTKVDKSATEVKRIDELIQFRNRQVHPKIGHQKLTIGADGSMHADDIQWSTLLNLPEFFYFLTPEHALTCLQAVDAFLENFIFDWAQLSPAEATRVLCHKIVIEDMSDMCLTSIGFTNGAERFQRIGVNVNYIDPHHFSASFSVKA